MVESKNKNILLIATTSYAGMGPYVASIVNSFNPDDNVYFFLIEKEDAYYSKNIKNELLANSFIIKERMPSKLEQLYNITIGGTFKYEKELKQMMSEKRIDLVHDLTGITDYRLIRSIAQDNPLLYSIHDLHPHEAEKAFYKKWRQDVLYKRMFKSISMCSYYYTNSMNQYDEISNLYPSSKVYFTDFPTLITKEIKHGKDVPPEINNLSDYILFFGRIEAYKGVDILIKAILNSSGITNKLVIAGKGDLNRIDDNSIIYINRYIKDSEIAELYKRAACVVYPYISATQSGVLSVASYFSTPIIASDIPFFKEVLGTEYPLYFKSQDSLNLSNILFKVLNNKDSESYRNISNRLYQTKYNDSNLRQQLLSIYDNILFDWNESCNNIKTITTK